MELKLNEKDMQGLIMELAKEMGKRVHNIPMKDYSPEQISEFRFVHPFKSVDHLIELYHSTPGCCFYDRLAIGVPGESENIYILVAINLHSKQNTQMIIH